MNTETSEEQFLIGLRELTLKTGIAIGGCGCCGSPYLLVLEPVEMTDLAGYAHTSEVRWISPADELRWKNYAKDIKR
jgi:hypothetical protein